MGTLPFLSAVSSLSHRFGLQTVKEFIEKVKAGGNKDVTLYMYPGEGHGFMNGGQDIHKMMKSKHTSDSTSLHEHMSTGCSCMLEQSCTHPAKLA